MATTWSRKMKNVALVYDEEGNIERINIHYENTAADDGGMSMSKMEGRSLVYADLTPAQQAVVDGFLSDVEAYIANTHPLPT